MHAPESRLPLMRIMLANAMLLSAAYALLGIVISLFQEHSPSRASERASLMIDSLPARALELVGLMGPIREAYFSQQIDRFEIRLIFGATAMVIIFALAFVVGGTTAGLRRLAERRSSRTPRGGHSAS